MNNIRLGDVLIDFGYITPDQLQTALAYQKQHKNLRVGQALQELGYVNERQVLEALAQRLQLRMIDFAQINVDISAVEKVPYELAQKYDMLPIAVNGRSLVIAANDPLNYYAIEDIRQLTSLEPEIVLAELEPLRRSIQYYYAEVRARKAASKANSSDMAAARREEFAIDMTDESGDTDAPIIRLLNSLVQRAATTGASDIHIEPFEGETKVRMRIDGVIIDLRAAAVRFASAADRAHQDHVEPRHRRAPHPAGRALPRAARDRAGYQRTCVDFTNLVRRKGRAASAGHQHPH